jgi:succinyl-diaminopimelate desuccinylase
MPGPTAPVSSTPAPSLPIDPVALTQALIRCPSVTPVEAGALDVLTAALVPLGFECHRVPVQAPGTAAVDNLYARLGTGAPFFCFAGHTDVVAPGDLGAWSADPFGGEIRGDGADARLFGRGAVDMKGAIAAFVAAVSGLLARGGPPRGSIGLLITGDEEGEAINGTRALLPWLAQRGERPDVCLVGEPTNPRRLGEAMKIGRRGSLNGRLVVQGTQGHVAYPHLADNPLPRLVRMLDSLIDCLLDEGTAHFPPSTLTLTSVDVGNAVTNVIPAVATAAFNIRFNPLHTAESLEEWLRRRFDAVGGAYRLDLALSGEAFLTEPGPFSALVTEAVARVTGLRPDLSTSGGTSDARFLKDLCPVVEFGLVGGTMHKADEAVVVADLHRLTEIYLTLLGDFFTGNGS